MLTFDEIEHKYFWNGREVLGVSKFLELAGFTGSKDFYKEGAAERGTEIHSLTELIDSEIIDLSSPALKLASLEVAGHVLAWVKFKHDTGFEIDHIEKRVYSESLELAGTVDRTGILHGKPVTVDLKTGAKAPWHRFQLACYNLIMGCQSNRYCVHTKADGTYRIESYQDDMDYMHVLRELGRLRGVR